MDRSSSSYQVELRRAEGEARLRGDRLVGLITRLAVVAIAGVATLAALWLGGHRAGGASDAKQPIGSGQGGVDLELVGHFDRPVYVHQPPSGADGLLFVVEQPGRVKVIHEGGQETFLDIENQVSCCGERGLFSIAFAPDYATSGLLYVYFTDSHGDIRIRQYSRSPDTPLAVANGSGRGVMKIEHSRFANHNGGQLQFGPDGKLYIGTGDGGSFGDPSENAQDGGSLLGKLLRIDPDAKQRRRKAVFAKGLRNPWRFSFDRETGNLVIGDVGQDAREEIDYETLKSARGANFGWDAFEGFTRFKSPDASPPPKRHDRPIHDYPTAGGNCAITGGYVVRDPNLPSLFGRYLYADFCAGEIRSLIPEIGGGRDDKPVGLGRLEQLSSFGEDAAGQVYAASLNGGVYRFVPR
jgi:glucose/arabinose dehydrogenase